MHFGKLYISETVSFCRTDVLHSTVYPTMALCKMFALGGSGQASLMCFGTVSIFNGAIETNVI